MEELGEMGLELPAEDEGEEAKLLPPKTEFLGCLRFGMAMDDDIFLLQGSERASYL